ncbi:hypothetical protein OAB57_00510 [Bacteriovoracaceae bacterium]|nr:hypothetical protein [Bacteriovoracaceae bacterium]
MKQEKEKETVDDIVVDVDERSRTADRLQAKWDREREQRFQDLMNILKEIEDEVDRD